MPPIGTIKPGIIPSAFKKLGGKITNEPVKQAIEAIGTAGIAPLAIIMSPGPNTRESKNEKKYQALRQIPSILLKYGMAFIVTVAVGKKISKAAWKSYLPKNMQSSLSLKVKELKDIDDLLVRIGIKKVSPELKNKLTELHQVSTQLKNQESKIKGFYDAMDNMITPFEAKLGMINQEKSIVRRSEQLTKFSKKFKKQKQVAEQLTNQYTEAKGVAKQLKERTTSLIRDIRSSGELAGSSLEKFDKFVQEYAKDSFKLYKQMLQAGVGFITLPFSAYMLNVVYPPFVKAVAPGLAKEVEEANSR